MFRNASLLTLCLLPLVLAVLPSRSSCKEVHPGFEAGPDERFDPALSDLVFMSGSWSRVDEGQYLEECWTSPNGDSMVGMFRWLRNEQVWLTELMTITVEEGTPIFRLRHFGAGLTPWEEKDGAFTYPMKSSDSAEVVFENPERNEPRRFIYRREGDMLVVRLEAETESGIQANEFRFEQR